MDRRLWWVLGGESESLDRELESRISGGPSNGEAMVT